MPGSDLDDARGEKLGVSERAAAVAEAIRRGLLE
jgi:hypothetical protein